MDYNQITSELAHFFASGATRTYRRKEVIVSSYVNQDKIDWIEKGYVKVVTYTSRGDQLIYHLYGPHELFPITIFNGMPDYPARLFDSVSFIAIGDVTVREKTRAEYKELIAKQPQLLLQTVIQQDFIYDRLYNFTMESAMHKVAYRLLTLGTRFGVVHDDHMIINLPITIQEIADTINVSRETTGRVLSELESKGYIMMSRKSVLVYPEPLEKMLGLQE
ncbi:MAG TPA: Crp/Fnr family transcriptional regulator [Candidatus Saccharimonadales bacterium]|nr:Crp/Fnr family transcriptional regulator [Candidatus Saccharimonadales bacterium]